MSAGHYDATWPGRAFVHPYYSYLSFVNPTLRTLAVRRQVTKTRLDQGEDIQVLRYQSAI